MYILPIKPRIQRIEAQKFFEKSMSNNDCPEVLTAMV